MDDLINNISVFGIDLIFLLYLPGRWHRAAEYLAFSVFVSIGMGIIGLWGVATHTVFLHKVRERITRPALTINSLEQVYRYVTVRFWNSKKVLVIKELYWNISVLQHV